MSRLKLSRLSCMLITILTTLLLTTGVAEAALLSWSIVTSPNPSGSTGSAFAGVAAVSTSDVWAVGDYKNSSAIHQTLTEHWEGTQWSILSSPNVGTGNNFLTGVTVISTSNVWAAGYFFDAAHGFNQTLIEHWNGTKWSIVPSPNNTYIGDETDNYLYGVKVISATNIWAVGYYVTCSGCGSSTAWLTLIEHWNGSQWSIVSSPSPDPCENYLYGVTAVSATNVWAVGVSGGFCLPATTLIEHWDGTAWSVVKSANVGVLYGVTAISANNAWAVGAQIEHWNGTTWSLFTSPTPGSFKLLFGVASISANNVWTVGQYKTSTGNLQTLIEHWNGTKWSIFPSGSLSSNLSFFKGIARVPGTSHLWAVGSYNTSKGSPRLTLTECYC